MNRFFSTLFSAFRGKITGLWNKLRLYTSLTFWRTKGITQLRQFFSKMFDIKPRDKRDYYSIFGWLVSKRLAYAAIIALGVGSLYLIFTMTPLFSSPARSAASLRTYKYTSIPLKYYSGTVRILGQGNYTAYIGKVDSGACNGKGSLYNRAGQLVYEGEFANSMYNGKGKLYYEDGVVRYDGEFVNNLYNGTGKYYRPNGVIEYIGTFEKGFRSGYGELYNGSGNLIFKGDFLMDNLLYEIFVGKTAAEASEKYSGRSVVYSSASEYCIEYSEIGAVLSMESGEDSLDEQWKVSAVHVLDDVFPTPGKNLTTINELTAYFGQPVYSGTTYVSLAEAVSMNILSDPDGLGTVDIKSAKTFDDVYEVSDYDDDYTVYIYTFELDGLLYTFYTGGGGVSNFEMYSIEAA